MRKALTALAVLALTISPLQASAAAAKAGAVCSKAGAMSTVNGIKYTCVKSGKKLVWNKGVKVVAAAKPTPTPTPTPTASPSPTPTPAKTFNSLWEKYNLTKPTSAEAVANAATKAFNTYTDVVRSPNQVVIVKTQEGVDPFWNNLLTSGMGLVAKSFAYPSFNEPVYAVAGLDADWMVNTFVSVGFSKNFAEDRGRRGFDDVVANAGGNTAIWNIANINKKNLLTTDKVGMYQTAGHEFFHPIQQKLFGGGNKFPPDGSGGPQWFNEGTAEFIGIQTVNKLGLLSYEKEGRPYLVRNVLSDPSTKSGKLEDAKYNLGRRTDVFPYNIGTLGAEFLVANVGIQKMVDVFSQLGTGKTFPVAFKDATGIELVDFYSMFEESRAILGIPLS